MFFYLTLSAVGMLWMPYKQVITTPGWFGAYTILLGWWLAFFPTQEYYVKNEEYFNRVL